MKKLLLALMGATIFASCGKEVGLKEEYITFDTYSFHDPDPVAQPTAKIFPYFRFDGFDYTPEEKKHKMVVLENKWIKVWIAPDIGGKIWGALDKKNNKYFIYHNNVVKFRDIAMRGPWTSGGIEHNFGTIGHAPTCSTPVDYCLRENADGSVSCFVGAIDLPSRTEWRVEVRVPKDKAWFETNTYWNNPTDLKTSLYHWENASADGTNDLRFYFPGNAEIDHGGIAGGWPINKDGRDVSLYGNNDFGSSKSYHILGEYADWFAGCYENSNHGFGHWTRQPVKPGKKIWIWSLARDGQIWVDLLTDPEKGNTQYIEMQTGLLYNQAGDNSTMSPFKHLNFHPGAVESFSELWFPLSNLDGVSSISKEGILSVRKDGNNYAIQFQSLGFITDNLQITDFNNNILSEFQIALEPQEIFSASIDLQSMDAKIRLANGELDYNMADEEANFLDRPLTMQEGFDWTSVYGLFVKGVEKSRQRSFSEATSFFERCLEKDTLYIPALISFAEIDYQHMKYDEAEKKLRQAIRFNAYNPEANFLYGVIMMKKKKYKNARDAFGVTLRTPQYKSLSRNKLAQIALLENRISEAVEYANAALLYNGMDKNNYRIAAVAERLSGDTQAHKSLLQRLTEMDPLNHFANFERYFLHQNAKTKSRFSSKITNELSYETYIELALWYYNAGLLNEAFAVMEICPEAPVADYLTAYIAFLKDDAVKSQFYLQRAIKADDKLVFPYREEYAEILNWADKQQTSWKTKYYSAILYWNRQQKKAAEKYFNECGNQPESYSFYLTRGKFFNDQKKADGEDDFLKGLEYGPDNWRPYHMLYDYYVANNKYDKALNITQKAAEKFKNNYILMFDYAMSLLYNNKYDESVKTLEEIQILPNEGARYGRMAWKNANLLNALNYYSSSNYKKALLYATNAYKWPENLGVGRPYIVDERAEDFIHAVILNQMGNKGESTELLKKIAEFNEGQPYGNSSTNYLSVMALKKLGQSNSANQYFKLWMTRNNSEMVRDWARLMLENKKAQAANQIRSASDTETGTPWNPNDADPDLRLINEIAQNEY